jgi:Zn-dependent protease with chaperone function
MDPHWPTWCDRCSWNVVPPGAGEPEATLGHTGHDDHTQARDAALCEEVCRQRPGSLRPARGARRLLATLVALLVYVPPVALLVAAAANLRFDGGVARVVIVTLCIACAVVLRPRFTSADPDAVVVTPATAPQLFDVITKIAAAVKATPPATVILTDSFDSDYQRVGARRRAVLFVGVPLWVILDEDERIALLAHQLAHDVNGDPARGVVVRTALTTLLTWQRTIRPGAWQSFRRSPSDDVPVPGQFQNLRRNASSSILGEALLRSVRRAIGAAIAATRRVELRLLAPITQRGEYIADDVAIRVASAAAVGGYLRKTLFADYVAFGIRKAAQAEHEDLWDAARHTVANLPDREMARLSRAAGVRAERVDAGHPPTALRMEFAGCRVTDAAQVRAGPGRFEAIDAELSSAYAVIATSVRDAMA